MKVGNLKEKMCLWLMISGIFVLAMAQKAEAARSGIKEVKPGTVYSQYDLDGDGIPDTFRTELIENRVDENTETEAPYKGDLNITRTLQIYVNDIMVFEQTRNGEAGWQIQLINLDNGKTFVDMESAVGRRNRDCVHKLYGLQDSKLKSVYDFQKYYAKYGAFYTIRIKKVSGNCLIADAQTQFFTMGFTCWNMRFRYEKQVCKCMERHERDTFTCTSNTFKIKYKEMPPLPHENKWTAGRKIKVYSQAGSKKIKYVLKKGSVIKINRIVFKKHKVYFQIKNADGRIGYILCAKKYRYPKYFEEAVFNEYNKKLKENKYYKE